MQKKVLVVDDDEDLLWSISKNLTKDKELYETLTAENGKKALEVLSQSPVDVVISDLKMPEMDGLTLLFEIKKHHPKTKVIIMTAYGSADIQKEATVKGSLYYIEKPFQINELKALIINAITGDVGSEKQVSDLLIIDIIQVNCFSMMITQLVVETEDKVGSIYFEDGNIVHAEVKSLDLEGEDAFFEILSWKSSSFMNKQGISATKETINRSWRGLLDEAIRRKDKQ